MEKKEVTNMTFYRKANVKEVIAQSKIQEVLKKYLSVPDTVMIRSVRKAFTDDTTKIKTQKIEAFSGFKTEEIEEVNFTLLGAEIDPTESIKKWYRLIDYTFALDANMSGGRFNGYSAKGFKLIVTKMEEIENGRKE